MTRIEILRLLQEKKISQSEAFSALKQLQENVNSGEKTVQKEQTPDTGRKADKHDEAIAIIGLSGRFPGAENAEEFWQNIKNGVDSVTDVPEERWSLKAHFDPDKTAVDKTYSKWSGLVKDIEYFDPLFFNLSPREASFIDPQQRLFLEECWKTFEDAGLSPDHVRGTKCGVYVGAGEGDYNKRLREETTMPYTLIGNSSAILSARISYLLNLKGPSMSINTACSGSLVAIHLGMQSILSGDCEMALAGGVYVHTEADLHVQTSKAGMLSEDGRCKAFDQSGNGFVPGEGVGVVLLKKLSQAEQDGDHIYGVIRGSKINQDGSTNGITAPSADSQKNLEIACYEDYKIDPSEISYVECHGTGTKLGDPIEIDALTGSFRKFTDKKQFCAIGSVKTNIGHALAAAGVAGVIKVLMSMKYGEIAPSIHFNTPNEHIDFKSSPFFVNTSLTQWKPVNNRRLAAISSFGFSGTNAHLVLEEYIPNKNRPVNPPPVIVPLSARSEKQLQTYARDLSSYLESHTEQPDQVAFTLQTGRKAHDYRVAFVVNDQNSLIDLLNKFVEGNFASDTFSNKGEITSRIKNAATNLREIASNWVQGQEVDWARLYKFQPVRVSLPTYPFEKVRCWIERKIDQVSRVVKPVSAEKENIIEIPEERTATVATGRTKDLGPIKKFLRNELSTILYIEQEKITDHKDFSKVGLDSVVGVEVINQINAEFGLSLEAQVVYDYPTIQKLAELIASQSEEFDSSITSSQALEVADIKEAKNEVSVIAPDGMKDFLRSKLSEILFIESEKITDQKEFAKIGLDSVVGVELINEINAKYSLDLEAGCLYEYKNLNLLTSYVAGSISSEDTSVETSDQSLQKANDQPEKSENAEVATSIDADLSEISSFLRAQLSKILFLDEDKIGDRTKFASIGLDSVVGVELVQAINEEFHTDIEAGSLYDYVTISELASFISSGMQKDQSVPEAGNKNDHFETDDLKADQTAIRPIPLAEILPAKPAFNGNGKVQLADLSTFSTLLKPGGKKVEGSVKLSDLKSNHFANQPADAKNSSEKVSPNVSTKVTEEKPASQPGDMAIIGLSGRYPGAKTLDKFWKNLKNGKNCITEIPKERWNFNDYYTKDRADRTKTGNKWGGFIADADKFSPLFFNLSPREAENIDPQERLLLEVIWATLEDSGHTADDLNQHEVGVFIGNMINQYSLMTPDLSRSAAILNATNWSLANRLSFFYDFRGPSIVVNTACSSSLTAIHMACESIRRGECRHAIAGGVNLNLHPSKWIGLSNSGMIGMEGQSQSLGNGEGYIPGEGVGTILIKSLEDAEADNDHIYGVIKGSHINHGGRSSGFTVPNLQGQIDLAKGIFRNSTISANEIDYIETASNGSQVGDPIEIKGLHATFSQVKKQIPIGTVKSNIGHCEAASGISQVTKVLLQYKHGHLTPSINSHPMNPSIDLEETPFYIQEKVTPIKVGTGFNTLVNSFGAGGSNTQLIISAYDRQQQPVPESIAKKLILLSAEDPQALKKVAGNLLGHIEKSERATPIDLQELAYTLQTGRKTLEYRMVIFASSIKELKATLKGLLSGKGEAEKVRSNDTAIEENQILSQDSLKNLLTLAGEKLFEAVAEKWLAGYQIDWKAFYGINKPARISLPTYPFQGESYWAGKPGIIPTKINGLVENSESPAPKPEVSITVNEVKHKINPIEKPDRQAEFVKNEGSSENSRSDLTEKLTELIRSICSDLLKIPFAKMLEGKPFSHYGIDSIQVKEISVELEKKMGSLPKTLFFQCSNIKELSEYLVKKHQRQVTDLFGQASSVQRITTDLKKTTNEQFLIRKDTLSDAQKEELTTIGEVKFPGGYLLDIWDSVYIGEDRSGYLHAMILPEEQILFGATYMGDKRSETTILNELKKKADDQGLKFCYWSVDPANKALESANDWISAPVGVWQNIENISQFTLEGGRMKKLRYMYRKFEGLGDCRTEEYIVINETVNAEIREVVNDWCKQKQYVHSVKQFIDDLNSGNWKSRYRIFLTYQADVLQNIILIGEVPGKGYLMDQEYYRCDMPLGGTEYTVAHIIDKIASEGSLYFSLGMTWVLVKDEYYSDEEGYQLIKEANEKETFLTKVFENADKNLQYKNKFRPVNKPGYFYRPAGSDAELIIRFLSLFMERGVSSDEIAGYQQSESNNTEQITAPAKPLNGHAVKSQKVFDPSIVAKDEIRIDLMSDSWVYFRNDTVKGRIAELLERVSEFRDYQRVIRDFFGFELTHVTNMGRISEKLLFKALSRRLSGEVISNLLFYTTAHHIAENGFRLSEIPDPDAALGSSESLFRGGIDISQLQQKLSATGEKPAMVLIEVCNNGAGGYPVSMKHLHEVKKLLKPLGIPLVLDMTRIIRNACLIQQFESGYQDKSIAEIINETCELADMMFGSLSKDFCVNLGGLIAVRDQEVYSEVMAIATMEGAFVNELEAGVIGESVLDFEYLEDAVRKQLAQTLSVGETLSAHGVAVFQQAKGHCLLLDADEIMKNNDGPYQKEALLEMIWNETGIRGGVHIPGQRYDLPLNHCIRLCLPLGLTEEEARTIGQSIAGLSVFKKKGNTVAPEAYTAVQTHEEPMAIIGMSGKFPGADSAAELWKKIESGETCTGKLSGIRKASFSNQEITLGLMSDVDQFDPLFFGISPKEARLMDPQQRLILEKTWEAMEDSGYQRSQLSEVTTGVFIGIPQSGYMKHIPVTESAQTTGRVSSIASSRISHIFNLSGPSEVYNTNCSSSFVALHRAIQSIRFGDCEQAIVGGVQVITGEEEISSIEALGVLSPTGTSRSFDGTADGYVRSEGVGAMIVKPLSKAQADGDNIYALIKSTATAHGGTGLSLTAPGQRGMINVMKKAIGKAGIPASTISYIEAHGISAVTPDAIELNAIQAAYSEMAEEQDGNLDELHCKIGAIKPSIGHAEFASGMAIIMKVIQAMNARKMPGIAGLEQLNEEISLDESHFEVDAQHREWTSLKDEKGNFLPRRAGLNSYGTGGVNAHIILEEYEEKTLWVKPDKQTRIFVLSADSEEVLRKYTKRFSAFIKENQRSLNADNLSFTLQTGREERSERLAVLFKNADQLLERLKDIDLKGSAFLFRGNTEDVAISAQLDGDSIDKVLLKSTLSEEDAALLADSWVKGAMIVWEKLYKDKSVRRLSLPTYPFDRKSYWVAETPEKKITETEKIEAPVLAEHVAGDSLNILRTFMTGFLSKELEMEQIEIKTDKRMADFGVDSIVGQKLAKELLNRFQIKVTGRDMLDHQTVDALTNFLSGKFNTLATGDHDQKKTESDPDLIALEKFKNGEISLEEIEKLM